MSEPITNAADAVRALGALPVPVGPEPQPLSGPICSQAEARAAGLDIAPSVEELDAMASTIVATGDPLSAEVSLAQAVPLLGAAVTGLRARVAELEAERHSTNEALDDAVQELRARREDEPAEAYVSRPLPSRDAVCTRPGCGHRGEDHHHGDTKCWAHLPRTRGEFGVMSPITICDCSGFVAAPAADEPADKLTALLAPSQVPCEVPDGEHAAWVRHSYRTPHDLPETGGDQC